MLIVVMVIRLSSVICWRQSGYQKTIDLFQNKCEKEIKNLERNFNASFNELEKQAEILKKRLAGLNLIHLRNRVSKTHTKSGKI